MKLSVDRKSFPLQVEVQDPVTNQKTEFVLDWADEPNFGLVVYGVPVVQKGKIKKSKPEEVKS